MNKYILVSTKFEGYLVYAFNKKGYLVLFENCAWGMTEEQYLAVLQSLGNALGNGNFIEWVRNCGHKIIKVEVDLSFERWWGVYDNARNRIAAEKLWKGMNDELRQYAFYVHEAYAQYLKVNAWCTKMYPDTFLRGHLRDEWYKIKPTEKEKK
jgi:hypothetical protein